MIKFKFTRKLKRMATRACGVAMALALSVGMLAALPGEGIKAAEQGEADYNKIMGLGNKKDVSIMKADAKNPNVDPYGYGPGIPFYLNTENELVLFSTHKGYSDNDKKIKVYDNFPSDEKTGRTGKLFTGVTNSSLTNPATDLNYAQMVALNPEGRTSGRDSYVAIVGLVKVKDDEDDVEKKVKLYVVNLKNGKSASIELGNANWMGDTSGDSDEDTLSFNASNFISITAGDYNGDGVDTIVVYGCYDGDKLGLDEVRVNINNGNLSLSKVDSAHHNNLLHQTYFSKLPNNNTTRVLDKALEDSTLYKASKYSGNHLSAHLASGDVNGDGFEDLVVLSYANEFNHSKSQTCFDYNMYFPKISVSFGYKTLSSDISATCSKTAWVSSTWDDKRGSWETMFAGGLSIGDVNGDHIDDIVVAGLYNEVKQKDAGVIGSKSVAYNVKKTKSIVGVYSCVDSNINKKIFQTTDTNRFTQGTTANGGYWLGGVASNFNYAFQPFSVQCFAMNGKGNADYIFLNGSVYRVKKQENKPDELEHVYTPDYFGEADQGAGLAGTSQTWIQSVAAGNFDGNECGYEQVIFTIGLRELLRDRFKYTEGMIGGIYVDQEGIKRASAQSYYCTDKGKIESGYTPSSFTSDEVESKQALNYIVCAVDVDNDGLLVEYKDKEVHYTDPSVMAIIQAAPYYEDTADFADDGNTSFTVTQSYSFEQTDSNSVSFGVGGTFSSDFGVGELSVKAGYALDWCESFTEGVEESHSYTFYCTNENQVAITRTPVVVYNYKVVGSNKDFCLSFPGESEKALLTVPAYNNFVVYYNKEIQKMADASKKAGNKVDDAEVEKKKMKPITDSHLLENEGNPYKYHQNKNEAGIKVLQGSPVSFDISTGGIDYSYGNVKSETTETSMAHGFDFEFEIQFGPEQARGGPYVSLNYMNEHAESKTDSKGYEISASRPNYSPALIAAEKITGLEDTIRDKYTFKWQLITWNSDLEYYAGTDKKTKKEIYEKVPVFGYLVTNPATASLLPKVKDFEAVLGDNIDPVTGDVVTGSAITLSWTKPSAEVDGYVLHVKDDKGHVYREKIAGWDTVDYVFTYGVDPKVQNGNVLDFYITAAKSFGGPWDENEGLASDTCYVVLDDSNRTIYKIAKTSSNDKYDTYTIYYSDGSKGSMVIRNGKEGSTITSIDLARTTATNAVYTVTMSNGDVSTFNVPLPKDGENGNGISNIVLTSSSGNINTYTIYYTNGQTFEFTVSNGLSAYEIAVKNGFVGSETEWLESLKGLSAYELVVKNGFNGTEAEWLESLRALSAYELAVKNGYTGDEAEWLESLRALSAYELAVKKGYTGDEAEWLESLRGLSAYELAVKNGYDGTEKQWLESLKGSDGKNGNNGNNGKDGENGSNGKSGSNGKNGLGIKSMKINKNGNLIVTLTDGTKVNAGALPTVTVQVEETKDVPSVLFSSVKTNESALRANWKAKKKVDGYQIRYSKDKNFKDSKIALVDEATAKTLKISGLDSNTTYYVQIRAYVEDGNKIYCSNWSKKVKVKTTKAKKAAKKAAK